MSGSEITLQDFATNLRQEILTSIDIEGQESFKEDKFSEIFVDYLSEIGEVDDGTICTYRARGMQINGYTISEDQTCLTIFVSNYTYQVPPPTVSLTDIHTSITRAVNFVNKCLGKFYTELEESTPVFDLALQIYELKEQLSMVRILYLTDGIFKKEKLTLKENINNLDFVYQVWDLERLYRAYTSGQKREIIELNLEEEFGEAIPCLELPQNNNEYVTLLAIIPGKVLAELYGNYGPRLLERNVRSFLQARGKVNSGIRKTIIYEPGMFLAYNNGISAIAEDIKLKPLPNGGIGIVWLKDLQIVNGAQTTASIYHTFRKDKADISNVFVQVKLTVISKKENADKIVPLISEYANSQNKIQTADFSANDPYHISLEGLSRTIWAPTASGIQKQTKWFYERARGQYSDDKERAGTPALKRQFEAIYPPAQKFTKTDLAKYENTWGLLPHIVSRGAQFNFKEFTIKLKERGNFVPDQKYYEHLIAKAIIFKSADKIIDQLNYGGYKANIVTYTLARLFYATGQLIDLDQIWKTQQISSALKNAIIEYSKYAYKHITNTPSNNANVTQWCKKEECWEHFRDSAIPLPNDLAPELKKYSPSNIEDNKDHGIETNTQEEEQMIAEVLAIGSEYWFKLSRWARETNNLQAWQRSIAYSLGKRIGFGKSPTRKQAKQALEIYEQAKKLGFQKI